MSPAGDDTGSGLPRLPLSYARAVAPWKRPATATTTLPERQAIVTGWRPDRARLAEYRALMGSSADMPLAFAQVPVMAMTMDLVSKWSFPVRALGMVHQGAVVEVLDDLPADESWDLRTWGTGGRHVRSGLEFDVWGEVSVAGRVRWRSRALYLSRSRAASGAEESAVPALAGDGPWVDEIPLPVTEGTGRAFARVSGDINPIHLHELPARAFGFRRAIVHGWWTAGRSAAVLDHDECVPGRTLEIAFRRPVELPSTPLLCSRPAGDGAVEFAVVAGGDSSGTTSGKPLAAGRITG